MKIMVIKNKENILFEFKEELAKEEIGGASLGKILPTGIYDVIIKTVSETTASTGAKGVDISFQISGAKYPNTIYGIWYKKADGSSIDFNMKKLVDLLSVAGHPSSPTVYNKTIEVKDGTKVVKAWKEVDDKPTKFVIKKVYGFYNSEVTEKNEIEAVLHPTGHTVSEKMKNSDAKRITWYENNLKDGYDKDYKKAEADGLISEGTSESDTEEDSSSGSIL